MGKVKQATKKLGIFSIRFYQICLAPLIGYRCRFYPSCSNYTQLAIERFGLIKGSWLGMKRIAKCHPWHCGGIDEVPE